MIRWKDIVIHSRARSIARGDRRIFLSELRFRLVSALLLAGPLSKEALFDHLYGDCEDGGPDSGTKVVEIMMAQMKRRLARIGLEICHDGAWRNRRHWAQPASTVQLEAAE